MSNMTSLSRITDGRSRASAWAIMVSCLMMMSTSYAFSSPASTSNLFRPKPKSSAASTAKSNSFNHNQHHHQKQWHSRSRRWRIKPPFNLFAASDDSATSSSITTTKEANGEAELTKLKKENELLQQRLKLLQIQNDELLKQQQNEKQDTLSTATANGASSNTNNTNGKKKYEQRLILEDFEGEGIPTVDARGGIVDGWNKVDKRYSEPWDNKDNEDQEAVRGEYVEFELPGAKGSSKAMARIGRIATDEEEGDDDEFGLSESPPMDITEDEVCEYDDTTSKWTSKSSIGECPVEPNTSFLDAMKSRAYWLVGLLAMQSCSGFILSKNELLLQDHPVIIYFLTMLVGAGGNAGNQASVRVIRGLALGTLNPQTQSQFLSRELRMAFALSAILSVAGFLRATIFQTPFPETMAVTIALSMIVFTSICLGAILPLLLQKIGVDPAHSSTTIQVVMDILGVVLTVLISAVVLDSGWGKGLIKAFGAMGL